MTVSPLPQQPNFSTTYKCSRFLHQSSATTRDQGWRICALATPALHHSLPAGRDWLKRLADYGVHNLARATQHVNSLPSPPPTASSLSASTSDPHARNQRNTTSQVIALMTTSCTLSCQTRNQICLYQTKRHWLCQCTLLTH